jgi:hypothetical protein
MFVVASGLFWNVVFIPQCILKYEAAHLKYKQILYKWYLNKADKQVIKYIIT